TWIEALGKARRWERLLEVSTAVLPQLEKIPAQKDFVEVLRKEQVQALGHLGRHHDAALMGEALGDKGVDYGYRAALQEARDAQDWELMAKVAGKLVAKYPKDGPALADEGEALARLERWSEAEPVLAQTVALNPKDFFAWSNLGLCRLQRGAWEEAAGALDQAIALNPHTPEPFANRGRARFELKQYQGSVEDYRLALGMMPGNALLAQNLAQAERYTNPSKIKR
ncbi:MAG TPA: tetratricopeptide repeat protein, partial [Holophagaceae bacterium]|nr:tetratricopeptide repeat protein [Holophagaceae bacterium]